MATGEHTYMQYMPPACKMQYARRMQEQSLPAHANHLDAGPKVANATTAITAHPNCKHCCTMAAVASHPGPFINSALLTSFHHIMLGPAGTLRVWPCMASASCLWAWCCRPRWQTTTLAPTSAHCCYVSAAVNRDASSRYASHLDRAGTTAPTPCFVPC
jgi:hypothetical protein